MRQGWCEADEVKARARNLLSKRRIKGYPRIEGFMAVLAEAISVIVRRDSIEAKYIGGWMAFTNSVPNSTMCTDGEIVRVGFMAPQDVKAFVKHLEAQGLQFISGSNAVDIAVADQRDGLSSDCDWLEFGVLQLDEERAVSACWFFDGPRDFGEGIYMNDTNMRMATPREWEFEGSLSQKFKFVPNDDIKNELKFIRRENSTDIFLDLNTGKEVAVQRTQTDDLK
jgi:hypothetical protein